MEIQGLSFGVNPANKKENIFGDDIGFVEHYDFSQANMSEKHRIHAISAVASICYQNPKALNSDSLYNRLMAESQGLPSSSFEFVPMLFDYEYLKQYVWEESDVTIEDTNMLKYGEKVEDGKYLLTNFRAVIYDKEKFGIDLTKHFNTEEECKIIDKHFKVFKAHIDLPTFGQMVRHRVNWQVVSRRYVSGKKMPFDFYISEKMKNVTSTVEKEIWFEKDDGSEDTRTGIFNQTTQSIIDDCLAHYYKALEDGVKPEEARRIIPQAAYTTAWFAMQPKQLDNFFKLRLHKTAQWEIQQTAQAMKDMLEPKQIKSLVSEDELYRRLKDIKDGNVDFITNEELEAMKEQKNDDK